jgi:hypothetical protein
MDRAGKVFKGFRKSPRGADISSVCNMRPAGRRLLIIDLIGSVPVKCLHLFET